MLPNGYDEARGIVFYQQLLERISALPGVEIASVATIMPLDIGSGSDMNVAVDGYQANRGEEISVVYNRVGPDYFETMGIPLVQGRAIDERDVAGREVSLVINETMARRYCGGRDPVGGVIRFGSGPAHSSVSPRMASMRAERAATELHVPAAFQYYRPDLALIVKTAGDPASVVPLPRRDRELDPNLPLFDVRTIEEHLQISLFIPRMASIMLTCSAVLRCCSRPWALQRDRVQRRAAHARDRHPNGARRRPRRRTPPDPPARCSSSARPGSRSAWRSGSRQPLSRAS